MSHEVTITVQLDPESYLEVSSGGRWFNIPSTHPITRAAMEQLDAIDFAMARGYFGFGFPSVDDAVRSAGARSRSENETETANYSMPFNPGGRAPDGFRYPLRDIKLYHDSKPPGSERKDPATQSSEPPVAPAAIIEPLLGGNP